MDRLSLTVVVMPIMILTALVTGIALAFAATSRSGRRHGGWRLARADALKRIGAAGRKARPPEPGAHDATPAEYLYVPCARIRYHGYPAGTRRWVQEVPIVKKTARWIYYTSDSWDRREAVVGPGRISRAEFETDTRCHDNCPGGEDRCRPGYPVGVIPIPGDPRRPGPAGRLFFATRQAAEDHLYREAAEVGLCRGERERAEQAAPQAALIKQLRRAMAEAHPDRGGTAEQFTRARRRYQAALRAA